MPGAAHQQGAPAPVTFIPTPSALEHLLGLVRLEAKELREGRAFVAGHPLLERRYEEAAAAVAELGHTMRRLQISLQHASAGGVQ